MFNGNKYLHIFNDSPYTHKFIRFIDEHFNKDNHQFIILCRNPNSKFINFYKVQDNCIVTENKSIYFGFKNEFKNSAKIIIHQFNNPHLIINLLLFYPRAFKKMIWVIWGGDVYCYKHNMNSLKGMFLELLRKNVIPKIPTIVSYIKGDYDKVVDIYKSNAKYVKAKYPSPIDIGLIKKYPLSNQHNQHNQDITIIVGNSADSSNEHVSAYEILEKYKNENIKVISILSYGGNKEYINHVIAEGKRIFQDKFEAIVEYMNFEDYLGFIANSDICLFNHKRQQGLANQLLFFALKKKVFVVKTTTPFKYYNGLGIDIYSTESIKNLSFDKFIAQNEKSKEDNRKIILEDFDEAIIRKEWQEVFDV